MTSLVLAVPVAVALAAGEAVTAPGWIPSTIGALVALAGVYAGYRQSTRVARINARSEAAKVEAGAYERARQSLEADATRRDAELARVEAKLTVEEGRSELLRTRVLSLEEEVSRLRRRLIEAGVGDVG